MLITEWILQMYHEITMKTLDNKICVNIITGCFNSCHFTKKGLYHFHLQFGKLYAIVEGTASLTSLYSIHVILHTSTWGHQNSRREVWSQSLAEQLYGFETRTWKF